VNPSFARRDATLGLSGATVGSRHSRIWVHVRRHWSAGDAATDSESDPRRRRRSSGRAATEL